jgi:hypothetical protein
MKDVRYFPEKEAEMCSKANIGGIVLLLSCTILTIIISGCKAGGSNTALISSNSGTTISEPGGSGSNSTGTSTSETTTTGTTTTGATTPTMLAWEAPLTYEDGITRIAPGDLTGYRIYLYTDSNLTAKYADYLVSGTTTSINLTDLNNTVFTTVISHESSTTYYLAVTAIVTIAGIEIESTPSNSVSYAYP